MIGQELFQITPRDAVSQLLQYVHAFNSATQNNASVFVDVFTVPNDKYFWTFSWASRASTAGAVNVRAVGGLLVAHNDFSEAWWNSVNAVTLLNWWACSPTHILLEPGSIVRCVAEYSAAAASNSVYGSVIGILIPKGNIAPG